MGVATYVSEGEVIDYTPSGNALNPGDVVDCGDFVGIATRDIAVGEMGALAITGQFDVTKKTGETWTFGQPIYWDVGTTSFTNTSSYSEAAAGICSAQNGAASGAATGRIILTPGIARS